MLSPRKPYLTLNDLAQVLHEEAIFAEARADLLARAALKVEQEGDAAEPLPCGPPAARCGFRRYSTAAGLSQQRRRNVESRSGLT
jgi:hypothetical protein